MTPSAARKLLIGRRVAEIKMNRYHDDHIGWVNEMVSITLDNGRRLRFMAVETNDEPAPIILDCGVRK